MQARDDYYLKTPSKAPRHKRAYSYSTVDEQHEQHVSGRDSDMGVFKVVIERPVPKTEAPFKGIPTLEVPIPSYKLGIPRFSVRGTAFLRGSSYSTADEMRSSMFSHRDASQKDASSQQPTQVLSRRHSDTSPQPHYSLFAPSSPFNSSPRPSVAVGVVRQPAAIVPEMFDDLTFKPACDHPSVVRYSASGGIKAATPARLVAEITSPTFVDYDLVSDFFLTFRSYLETADLLYMLIARLKWALAREDGTGMVVRVRTFVAIRHWILNYFLDDYVVDYDLRKSFCDLLNGFVSELLASGVCTKVPMKILGELKKCWRRVCALYWDGPEFDTELGPDVPILPGGVAGSRDPNLDPSFWETQPEGPPRLDGIIEPDSAEHRTSIALEAHSFLAEVPRTRHIDSMVALQSIPAIRTEGPKGEPPLSPTSIMSEDFVSCSLPPSRVRAIGSAQPLASHPVPANPVYDPPAPVATTPRALSGKRVRPANSHKRSGSFSDSFRDHRAQQPVQRALYKSTELLLTLPYAGSLVRGNLFPPGQPFVEAIAPGTPAETSQANSYFPARSPNKSPSAMSGPGMKKLLGSVRRALSTKAFPSTPTSSPTQGSFPHIPPLGVRGATINRLPGTAIVPQARPRNSEGRAPMRIDLLGAEVAEDFKKAVREDAEADAQRREESERKSTRSQEGDDHLSHSTLSPNTALEPPRQPRRRAPVSEMTTGSKSIVIVDDTMTFDSPTMTGALSGNVSIGTFADAFRRPSGGPTPPSTPPDMPLGIPRRSSHLLGEHVSERPVSSEATPSMVLDSRPSGEDVRSPSHQPFGGRSMQSRRPSIPKKPSSLRRYASYQSGFTHHRSERSFDATTVSEEVDRISHVPSLPLPLRVLRRRPGGDLRAVANVGELSSSPLQRPKSTGSLATYSDSVRSSYLRDEDSGDYVDVVNSDYEQSQSNVKTFSLGALAEASTKKPVSLFSTHSSQPVMRPSFEKEAQLLAQIPDDADDDGGVESALLKLEGKYEPKRRSDLSEGVPRDSGIHNSFGATQVDVIPVTLDEEEEVNHQHQQEHMPPAYLGTDEELQPTIYQPRGIQETIITVSTRSVESYNSTPLLERGLTDDEMMQRRTQDWSERSIFHEPSLERHNEHTPESSHANSFDFVNETDSMKGIDSDPMEPNHVSHEDSFLESDSENRSDLSSEISLEVISRTEYTERDTTSPQTFPPTQPGTVMKEMALPSHPLRHPPSPPMTLSQAPQTSPINAKTPQIQKEQLQKEQNQHPPSPENTRKETGGDKGASSPLTDPLRSHRLPEASRKTSAHLPFILAFDSQVLAQQFTLIEKDALNEIDWKDLIEMRWKDANTDSRSWVDFLRTSEPRGVEVVIARFNLMVKWAISECVLTQDLGERVQCIIKYIHIAAHCRRYRNFATMTQLTIALTSKDISRLTNTWAHVPAADIQTLRELEALITPTRNFHSLRAEMEGCGADQGCIPFVGIYTHDLLANSERPSQIAGTPTTEPLVNFERCRTDATVVKNLLRLLEASQLYRFLPIEGITERCLWMAALSDEEITKYGKMIQE